MEALGIMLFFIVAWAWMWPEKVGAWVADYREALRQEKGGEG